LFALHITFNDNVRLIRRNIQEFYHQFYLVLNSGKYYHQDVEDDFYVDLSDEEARVLLENFEEEIDDSALDISSLRDFMERDILP